MGGRETTWFFSEGVDYTHKNKGKTRDWISKIIESERFTQKEINIIFCSDKYLLEINNKYLKNNTLTDIITFDFSESENEHTIKGDIYISIERARDNALKFKVTFEEEIRRLIVHGILHLAGYKDKDLKDRHIMTLKEDYYLSLPPI